MKIAYIVFICLLLPAFGYAESIDLGTIKQLLQQSVDAMPEKGKNQPRMTLDALRANDSYKKLTSNSVHVWRNALGQLETVAPTRATRSVLLCSFESLPAEEYVQMLEIATEMYRSHRMHVGEFSGLLFPPGPNIFLLSHNYDHPRVKQMLHKASSASEANGDPVFFNIKEVQSGKLKELHDAARARDAEFRSRPIPVLNEGTAPTSIETPIPDRAKPETTSQSTPNQSSKPTPTITPAAKPQAQPSSSIPLVVGLLLLLAVAGFVFFWRKS